MSFYNFIVQLEFGMPYCQLVSIYYELRWCTVLYFGQTYVNQVSLVGIPGLSNSIPKS